MRRILPSVALVAGLALSAANAQAQVAPTGSWGAANQEATSPYYPMYYGDGVSDGTYLYYCGTSYSLNYQQVLRYDPATNVWSTRANMPEPCYYNSVAIVGGTTIWSFGNGYYGDGSVYSYNISTNVWSTSSTTLTNHTYGCGAAALGTTVYIVGGYGPSGYSTATTAFDTTTQTATNVATLPFSGNWYMPGVCAEPNLNRVYLCHNTSIYEFNPTNNTWVSNLATRPSTLSQYGAVWAAKLRVYTLYGTTLYEYFPSANTWTQRASSPASYTSYGPAAFAHNVNVAYVWGGNSQPYYCYEYTMPSYGLAPDPASSVQQIGSLGVTAEAGTDPNAGWTDSGITFQANCTDPDAGQQVRLEVQVKKASDPWSAAVQINSTFGPPGTHSIFYAIPTGDDYHWRYHVMDDYGNFTPNVGGAPAWTEFGAVGTPTHVDFRSDQQAPSVPVAVYPISQDVLGPSTAANDVTFVWNASTDNGPVAAIRYSVEVAHNDPAFGTISASASGLVPTQHTFNLPVSRYNYFWHVGATDIGGNFSGWSAPEWFRVVGDDGENHGAGDAGRVLGCSAAAGSGAVAAMAGLALAALGLARRMIRK